MSNPIVATYIDQLSVWYPPEQVMSSITKYQGRINHLILAFWESTGPLDVAKAWVDGTFPKDAIDTFHQSGIKVMVSAGGATVEPITNDPAGGRKYGEALGQWAREHGLDGVDFDIEDNSAFKNEPDIAVNWMVDATEGVKKTFPGAVISHAPQAPYFSPVYGGGPYLRINSQVGGEIDFYNVQFYNQGSSGYDTFDSLFIQSSGWATDTAVQQLVQAGVALDKILVGKPVEKRDATNTGYVPAQVLAEWIREAAQHQLLPGGVMGWQFHSDEETKNWSTTLHDALTGATPGTALPQALRMPHPHG